MSLTRRQWLQQMVRGGLVLGCGTAAYSSGWEIRRPMLTHNPLPCPFLPESIDPLRVVHLTDLHADDWTPQITIERAVQISNAAKPDIVVFTGDFISSNADRLERQAESLRDLHAPLGKFACLGNHDIWNRNRQSVIETLRRLDIQPLVNETRLLATQVGPVALAGLDSAWAGRPNLSPTLRAVKDRRPLIILQHEPDVADTLARMNLAACQLSGHTHGGQVRAPFWGAMRTPYLGRKYVAGNFRVGDIRLYVNRGLGSLAIPFRFLCLPEVTLHTLVPA